MKIEDRKKITDELLDTFIKAGDLSLELRKKGLIKEIKEDNTPVTNGDLEVNKILVKKIGELTPEIPIISEETSKNKDIKDLSNFWLIDPIDGTFDYINNREEFTLNAALIINKKPNKPPIVMMITKVEGTVQIAFPPICADNIPTLIIARK